MSHIYVINILLGGSHSLLSLAHLSPPSPCLLSLLHCVPLSLFLSFTICLPPSSHSSSSLPPLTPPFLFICPLHWCSSSLLMLLFPLLAPLYLLSLFHFFVPNGSRSPRKPLIPLYTNRTSASCSSACVLHLLSLPSAFITSGSDILPTPILNTLFCLISFA